MTTTTGQCVGDEGLLDTDNTDIPRHLFGAVAKTPAFLYFMRQDDLAALFHKYPTVEETCAKAIALKIERWQRQLEKLLRESVRTAGDGPTRLAAHTYEPDGELSLPVFSSKVASLSHSADTKNIEDREGATLDRGAQLKAGGSEPSNKELAAKVDALDDKLNKVPEMLRRARFEHRK